MSRKKNKQLNNGIWQLKNLKNESKDCRLLLRILKNEEMLANFGLRLQSTQRNPTAKNETHATVFKTRPRLFDSPLRNVEGQKSYCFQQFVVKR